ncbi:MAG: Plug domain-containing protein, partial [Bergeyella zoohelcum]|nr:Plug domain-containing protein [Bergeyella zoohelcum]
MKKKYSLTYFCVLPCFLFAQKKTDTLLKTKDIEQIIIAMKRNEDGVIASQKLSGKELQNINSLSVADAVRYFSGVQIKDYGGVGGLKTINIRGMGTQNVGVFYDGIQLGNAQNGTIDLGKFSLENMESVSVYNGQKSEILQSAKDFG